MSIELLKTLWQDSRRNLTLSHSDSVGESHLEVIVHMDASELPEDREEATDKLLGMAINRLYLHLKTRARKRGEPSPPGPWEGEAEG